ncbi:MAG TPA: FG-GAP-like repeat-containing protein [Kofleriaceae bacterium]|nr:FG-GAP-like repeat-containing protein [Kofleriaceae bacterium]
MAVAVALGLGSGSAAAAEPTAERSLGSLWRDVRQAIELAVAERSRRPPVPVAVNWRERRIASADLGAPLLALAAVDVDRDGRVELAALTTQALVLLAPAGKVMRELGRASLPGEPAAIRPRDPVGTLVVDARAQPVEILARSSELAEATGFSWREGALRETRRVPGFPLCPELRAELAPGRNYFDGATLRWDEGALARFEAPAAFFNAICRADLGDPTGKPLWVTAVVDVERVARLRCGAAQGECQAGPTQAGEYTGVGVVVEVADIDNDGNPEVLTTRGGAPGDRDRVSVYSRQGDRVARVFAKDFHAGVVGLVAGDLDGDGDRDVVVAVRFAGSRNVSFWTLN